MDEIRDSIFTSNLRPLPNDSLKEIGLAEIRKDTVRHSIVTMEKGIHESGNGPISSNIRVIISSDKDSITREMLRPLSVAFDSLRADKKTNNFIIRISDDSINTNDLKRKLSQTLVSHKINTSFEINHIKDPQPPKFPGLHHIQPSGEHEQQTDQKLSPENPFALEPVRYNPLHKYSIVYDGEVAFYLLRQIAPEISFCIFLTLITCSAFFLIYRNFRKQERLGELKDEFINNVTHELKTPISTVSVALEALQNFTLAGNKKLTQEYLSIARTELTRLSDITDKILKASMLEDAVEKFAFSLVDLKAISEEVLSAIRILGVPVNANISFRTEGSNFLINGSNDHIRVMLYNLLENALKYSPVEPEITLMLKATDTEITIEVKDNGIGIADEYKEKIFEKFFRVPSGNLHEVKGFGLGLNYVSSVVKLHHGRIDLISSPGKGSLFIITFPR